MSKSTISAWRHIWLFALMILGPSLDAAAATPLNMPTLDVQIRGPLGNPVFSARSAPLPYSFDVEVTLFNAGLLLTADLYFGVLLPGGEVALTWVNEAGNIKLQEGMTPIAGGLDMNQAANFSLTQDELGQAVEHVFTGSEPLGMYMVFALLVATDEDPGETQNWIAVDMEPLFLKPALEEQGE